MRYFAKIFFLISACSMFLFACKRRNSCDQDGVVLDDGGPPGATTTHYADFFLQTSILPLARAEDLIIPNSISGRYFCLSENSVIYDATAGSIKQPCFNLALSQDFVMGPYVTNDGSYRAIDPEKFLAYYKSIPPELNKFLVVQVHQFNTILKKSQVFKPTPSSYSIWSSNFNPAYRIITAESPIFLAGILHGALLTDEDAYFFYLFAFKYRHKNCRILGRGS